MAVVYGSLKIVAISAIVLNMKTSKKLSHTSLNGRRNSAAVVDTSTAAHVRRQDARTFHFLTQDELRLSSDT